MDLHALIREGNTSGALAYLAEHRPGADALNTRDGDQRTPLHWAVASDDRAELVRRILEVPGVDVNTRDPAGWTPLMSAASAGASRIVAELLAHGADPTAGNVRHITPLHYAASKGHAEIARQLLVAGADVNAADGARQRPMYVCLC